MVCEIGRLGEANMKFQVLCLILIALFSSCALGPGRSSPTKIKPSGNSIPGASSKPKEVPVEGSDTRITGTANISQPAEHKGKFYYLHGAEHLGLDNYYFDFPVVYNDSVKKWVTFFINEKGRPFFERYSQRAGRYAPIMGKILEEYNLPRDLIFLAMAESGFNNVAKSWARAVGPWQFMPFTGKNYGLAINWYVDERRDPIKATVAAAKYLDKLYGDFGSWELAAAGYNAGEGKVSRAIKKYRTENFWKIREGKYLKAETKQYVPKIMALAIIGKNLKAFGFQDIDFHEPLDFEEIIVPPFTDLFTVAEKLAIDYDEIHRLNPEILRWFTSPHIEQYPLRVPVGYAEKFEKCCRDVDLMAKDFQTYEVEHKSKCLRDIARTLKIDPGVLEDLNSLPATKILGRGEQIFLPFRSGQTRTEFMYADLYEKPKKVVLRRQKLRERLSLSKVRGKKILNPSEFYVVRQGDSLWTIAKKKGVSLDTLIKSNLEVIDRGFVKPGDRLVIR
jgi:membrane-bound lytic murein transglycosylase D